MALQTPAWLWLLLPWAALVLLTLRAYRAKRDVPFLDLWPREEVRDDRRRAWRPPAWPIVLLLIATLAAILGMSRPTLPTGQARIGRLTLVLDRGVGMLADQRQAAAVQELQRTLVPLLSPDAQLRILDPLQPDELIGPSGLENALSRPATALDLTRQVSAAAERSHDENQPTLILTSSSAIENVGIIQASVKAGECWLHVRNDSPRASIPVLLQAGGQTRREEIQLPPKGESKWYSLKCPASLPLCVELELDDALEDDNGWWILPDEVPARLQIAGDAPGWLKRFAESYTRVKKPNELSPDVLITTDAVQENRTVSISVGEDQLRLHTDQPVPDHLVLAHVTLPDRLLAGGALPSGEWQVLLSSNGRPLLASSDTPRGVWIGFRPQGEVTPDYLILLSNAVRYCCGVTCSAGSPEPLGDQWQCVIGPGKVSSIPGTRAGLYRKGDAYRAINLSATPLNVTPATAPISDQIASIARDQSRTSIAPWLYTTAAAMIAIVAALVFVARGLAL